VKALVNRWGLIVVLAALIAAGCASTEHVERPEGPFEIALLVTTDTRGELEPCG